MTANDPRDDWAAICKQFERLDRAVIPPLERAFGRAAVAAVRRLSLEAAERAPRPKKIEIRREADPDRTLAWAIAQNMRAARERAGLRQEDLAERTGIARPNIARLERGAHLPAFSTLRRVAQALGIELAELVRAPAGAESPEEERELGEGGLESWAEGLDREDGTR